MSKTDQLIPQIQDRISTFVEEINELVRDAALEAVNEALGGSSTGAGATKTRRAPAARSAAPKSTARKAGKGKRVRRTADQVEAIAKRVRSQVESKPGQRLGDIAKSLGMATKDVRRPAFLLVEAGTLRTEGQRGGTRYFSGKGKATAKAGKAAKPAKRAAKKTKRRASKKG